MKQKNLRHSDKAAVGSLFLQKSDRFMLKAATVSPEQKANRPLLLNLAG
jgi:hypothetical protein